MKKISDDRLDKMLTEYCEAPVEPSFSYDPERAAGKTKPRIYFQRQLMAAAAFVLVAVLGSTAYFLIGNKPSVPTAVEPTQQSTTAAYAPTVGSTQPTVSTAQPTEPTQKPTQKPTAAPTQRSTQSVSAAAQAVDQNTPAPVRQPSEVSQTEPAVTPTQPATVPVTPAQQPTDVPTELPTELPPDKPRDLAPVGYDGIIIEKISVDDVGDGSNIYCRIYTEDGTPVDDGDPYSDLLCARRLDRDGVATIYYVPCDSVTLPYEGLYRFEFYDETGRILYTGDEYLKP